MPLTIPRDSDAPPPRGQKIGFDSFEVDLRSGELRKDGIRLRLQAQPFQLLILLLENAGEVVSREEVCGRLWPGDTFVDFEHSLPAAVNKIREALGDAAANPRYIETLPKRGYRFIGKIKAQAPVVMTPAEPQAALGLVTTTSPRERSYRWRPFAAMTAVVLAGAAALVLLSHKTATSEANAH